MLKNVHPFRKDHPPPAAHTSALVALLAQAEHGVAAAGAYLDRVEMLGNILVVSHSVHLLRPLLLLGRGVVVLSRYKEEGRGMGGGSKKGREGGEKR